MEQQSITPAHQWTDGGDKVLLLKCVNPDGSSYGDFVWPRETGATVEAPDWTPRSTCEGGLFGWPWGIGMGDGKDPDWNGLWIVFSADPAEVIQVENKAKAKKATIKFVGGWQEATNFLLAGQIRWVQQAARGAASATGERGAASATGGRGAASATGFDSKARAGKYGCLALAWWNAADNRGEMLCRAVGCGDGSDGKLKANTWYCVDAAGEFVEVVE